MPFERPLRLVVLALALAACTPVERPPAPLDRYSYPTGMALSDGHLFVVSSNFDLTYQDEDGGSVLVADPEAWLDGGPGGFVGSRRIPSFGGEIAIATPEGPCGVASTVALVPSRLSSRLYRFDVSDTGALSCGAGCEVEISDPGASDPFAVELLCRPDSPPRVLVGWLRTRLGASCGPGYDAFDQCAVISEVSLNVPGATPKVSVLAKNQGSIRQLRYDAVHDLLFFVGTGASLGWVDLSTGCEIGAETMPCPVQSIDLRGAANGLEVRSIAFSSGEPRRLYVAARLYDTDAALSGIRIDVGGALVVLQLEASSVGGLAARLVRIVPLSTGVSQIATLPTPAGRGDVVAVSASDDGAIWFYDDAIGAITGVIGRDPGTGVPMAGELPYALVAEDHGDVARLYVGAFQSGVVSVWDVDPDDPEAATWMGNIGG